MEGSEIPAQATDVTRKNNRTPTFFISFIRIANNFFNNTRFSLHPA
jgi:hypothetical protein